MWIGFVLNDKGDINRWKFVELSLYFFRFCVCIFIKIMYFVIVNVWLVSYRSYIFFIGVFYLFLLLFCFFLIYLVLKWERR